MNNMRESDSDWLAAEVIGNSLEWVVTVAIMINTK